MADNVIKKSNSKLKFLFRNAKFLSTHAKKLLVSSLIQCHFDYSCSFWYSGLTKKSKSKLQISQNKIMRHVLNLGSQAHIGCDEFVQLNWLPVHTRVEQIKLHHFHPVFYKTAPSYLTESVELTVNRHTHNTRHRVNSVVAPSIGNRGKREQFCKYILTAKFNFHSYFQLTLPR